jgi:hypothetical protein
MTHINAVHIAVQRNVSPPVDCLIDETYWTERKDRTAARKR